MGHLENAMKTIHQGKIVEFEDAYPIKKGRHPQRRKATPIAPPKPKHPKEKESSIWRKNVHTSLVWLSSIALTVVVVVDIALFYAVK